MCRMKKRALGSFCVTNVICSIFLVSLFLYGIVSIIFDFVFNIYDDFFYLFLYILFIFIALQRLFRVKGCYYEIKEDILCFNYLTIKKRTKWYDFMMIGRSALYSYQKEYRKIKYTNILSIDFVIKEYVTKYIWKKKVIMIEMKNDESILMVNNVFSKKQLREIVNFIQERNGNLKINENIREYLNLT